MSKFVLTEKYISFPEIKIRQGERKILFVNNKMKLFIVYDDYRMRDTIACIMTVKNPFLQRLINLKSNYKLTHSCLEDHLFLMQLPNSNNFDYMIKMKSKDTPQSLINNTITFFLNRIREIEELQRIDRRMISVNFDKFIKSFNKKAFDLTGILNRQCDLEFRYL